MRATIWSILVVGMVGVVGCGGGGGVSTSLEDIYTIATWTENPTACDAEGPTILPQAGVTAFYIEPASIFGQSFINAVKCADVADCMTKQADTTIYLDGWTFDKGSDTAGWTGATSFAGGDGTQCSGEVSDLLLTGTMGTSVRIESRTRMTAPFPPDKDGFCTTDAAKVAAQGMPCVKLEVVTGTPAP